MSRVTNFPGSPSSSNSLFLSSQSDQTSMIQGQASSGRSDAARTSSRTDAFHSRYVSGVGLLESQHLAFASSGFLVARANFISILAKASWPRLGPRPSTSSSPSPFPSSPGGGPPGAYLPACGQLVLVSAGPCRPRALAFNASRSAGGTMLGEYSAS